MERVEFGYAGPEQAHRGEVEFYKRPARTFFVLTSFEEFASLVDFVTADASSFASLHIDVMETRYNPDFSMPTLVSAPNTTTAEQFANYLTVQGHIEKPVR